MENIETLENLLQEIGWKIGGRNNYKYLVDHEGKKKSIRVSSDRVAISDTNYDCCFYFDETEFYSLEQNGKTDCVGLRAKDNDQVFIQFYNHSK